jgi:AraC-like DNA-binding protein
MEAVYMVDQRIIRQLRSISAEEQAILDGRTTIDRGIYMVDSQDVINSRKLLSDGKLITFRPHTRFIHFPEHCHDYVEVVYMCSGTTTHIVNGKTIRLQQGELLFLSQSARQEILRAEENDIAVNFVVLPEFFQEALSIIGEEATPLRRFLLDCLFEQNSGPGYLLFQVSDNIPIQNLVENLIFSLLYDTPNRRKVSQMTMTLLFLQLLGHTDKLVWDSQEEILQVLRYVDEHYVDGSLHEAAALLHSDVSSLSREIRRKSGKTYTELVQEKRLNQAAFLLRTTDRKVEDIALAVGYENISYFHRIFRKEYGVSPRQFRIAR